MLFAGSSRTKSHEVIYQYTNTQSYCTQVNTHPLTKLPIDSWIPRQRENGNPRATRRCKDVDEMLFKSNKVVSVALPLREKRRGNSSQSVCCLSIDVTTCFLFGYHGLRAQLPFDLTTSPPQRPITTLHHAKSPRSSPHLRPLLKPSSRTKKIKQNFYLEHGFEPISTP